MTEVGLPTAVRRTVAFADAVYEGRTSVEGIEAIRCPAEPRQAKLLPGTRYPWSSTRPPLSGNP